MAQYEAEARTPKELLIRRVSNPMFDLFSKLKSTSRQKKNLTDSPVLF